MKPFDVVAAGVLTAAVALGSDPVLDDNSGQVVQAIRDQGIAGEHTRDLDHRQRRLDQCLARRGLRALPQHEGFLF